MQAGQMFMTKSDLGIPSLITEDLKKQVDEQI
jgi:hypothetical protein